MSENPFQHDPTDSKSMSGSELTSFDEAKNAVDSDEDADGLGFTLTRHDPFLVIEISNGLENGEIREGVSRILSSLGETYLELDDDSLIRAMYHGQLPGDLHGGNPVIISIGGGVENYALRLFDSGWTPVTGRRLEESTEDLEDINQEALTRLLEASGKFDG